MTVGFVNRWLLAAVALLSQVGLADGADDLRAMVEADWSAQEKRRGRKAASPEAIRDALTRAERLKVGQIAALCRRAAEAASLDADGRLALYRAIRWASRERILSHPLLAGRAIVFLQRRRFICQMLHEYVGYYCDYGDTSGGGVYVLPRPGRSLETRDVIAGRLPRGNYTTLSLSYDARTVYFAFAPRAKTKPGFYSPQRRYFAVHAVGADGTALRRLSDGTHDEFDPCPLPDGHIAFMSTRRGGYVRCNNPWEPLPVYTLHRMDADGGNVRTLSFHETNEWHPSVLNDGRIVYSRWDYVDRSAANFHGLWASNPDGTSPVILFGNYTRRISACYQPRAIPGSTRIVFIAGAHHADVGGSLVILDPSAVGLDRTSAGDRFEAIETLSPEIAFPEGVGWSKGYFHSPWPLSQDRFLVSFGYEKVPGMSSGNNKRDVTGLYYFDRFGNLELLYRRAGISCTYPVPLWPRPRPPVLAPRRQGPKPAEEGEFVLTDVRQSHLPLPDGRTIRSLRVFQVLPKSESHIVNQPRIGHANAESARMLLGTVPVEADGSAYFRAPARKPLYFQAVDQAGRAVQSMRSVTYLQPGERRGCIGCHEPPGSVAGPRRLMALARPASVIRPGPDGSRPFGFPRLVQPVLDRHCVRCHDGKGDHRARPVLTGERAGEFTRSYNSLRPYVRWYEWGGASIAQNISRPGQIGVDASRLAKVLAGAKHAKRVRLSAGDRRRLFVWLDGNVPFYGTYSKAERAAQHAGRAVAPPALQ